MPRIKFEDGDSKLSFPTDTGGMEVVDLSKLLASDLANLCKSYGLRVSKRCSSEYLKVLRAFSNDPSQWSIIDMNVNSSTSPSRKKQKTVKSSRGLDQEMELLQSKGADIEIWLNRIDSLVDDPYGIVTVNTSTLSAVSVSAISSLTAPLPQTSANILMTNAAPLSVPFFRERLLALQSNDKAFVETFTVALAGYQAITFTSADIREFPVLEMPRSPHQYLVKLLSVWDNSFPTWESQACPSVGGVRIPAKYWKIVFSKAGHWKIGRYRMQWHQWKLLIEELQSHDNCPELLCEIYAKNMHPVTISNIALAIRRHRLQRTKDSNDELLAQAGDVRENLLRDVTRTVFVERIYFYHSGTLWNPAFFREMVQTQGSASNDFDGKNRKCLTKAGRKRKTKLQSNHKNVTTVASFSLLLTQTPVELHEPDIPLFKHTTDRAVS
ncbi:uncharacterized protein C8R40DRAFT_1165148 [Lentinula edodes]|uniref:uncharacterized protein n=1 Tax=Lentinula edodes TaxID=5353 RepID=UPI001E8ECA29|nr:uncharacterized protein C8R40DRAFT_1165148 [Lentinula edodes]KAH7880243.1 hypothetical protein C8R40DRAFT_1165148 [Lentinula edodes]